MRLFATIELYQFCRTLTFLPENYINKKILCLGLFLKVYFFFTYRYIFFPEIIKFKFLTWKINFVSSSVCTAAYIILR